MKKILILFSILLTVSAYASDNVQKTDAPVKDHLKNHFKLYGFIRNYACFDTRESMTSNSEQFYYMPKDEKLDANGEDINEQTIIKEALGVG